MAFFIICRLMLALNFCWLLAAVLLMLWHSGSCAPTGGVVWGGSVDLMRVYVQTSCSVFVALCDVARLLLAFWCLCCLLMSLLSLLARLALLLALTLAYTVVTSVCVCMCLFLFWLHREVLCQAQLVPPRILNRHWHILFEMLMVSDSFGNNLFLICIFSSFVCFQNYIHR